MPIYAYRCRSCAAEFELLVRASDETAPACPECSSTDLSQRVSRVAPPGKAEGIFASARKQAATEGHFSNYSKAEKSRIKM
ncbi:FmdB family zinc ribbon protein [Rhodovulum adriaticum]|uniref:Putative FmdB family regulatory protein n=1 Tax=Rhodovulum adriaticum TaxID=35804 RepID=A0A4R2NJP1_RHOAD|nr:zinc ribbon domain-containing protein [Rhodovulum adriaticum]MBK1635913.1 FmdB family transcriptional regulator [Rhodovulum adriaticum]TCP21455.1 putative FmdB family regulatory protein [Rhodovulum adriaticum]